jgi:hypothetical protein
MPKVPIARDIELRFAPWEPTTANEPLPSSASGLARRMTGLLVSDCNFDGFDVAADWALVAYAAPCRAYGAQ